LRFAVSHISRKTSEIWGTLWSVTGKDPQGQRFVVLIFCNSERSQGPVEMCEESEEGELSSPHRGLGMGHRGLSLRYALTRKSL
jgi:hypothetical protein